MKQTAVEWYSEQLARIGVTEELIGHLTKEAKVMEKAQIVESHKSGQHYANYFEVPHEEEAEKYYSVTFKSK